jgi:transcription elongation factor GreB
MSRAFAPGESDDDEERFVVKASVLPPGTPNYITPEGAAQLEAERERLIAEKASLGDSVEQTQRRKSLDAQLSALTVRLNSVTIIRPTASPEKVVFGSTVNIGPRTFRIVGVDEVDLSKGWISWISPLAKALLDKRVGESVKVGDSIHTISKIV